MKNRGIILVSLILGFWLHGTQAASLVDTTFNPGSGANGIVEQVLQLPDGKVLVCGNFTTFNGENRGYIARLNNNGSVDLSFQAGPGYWVRHMAAQPDGKIVIGGFFTNVEGQPRNRIARLNANGSLDTSFNPGAGCEVIIGAGIDGNIDPFVMWCEVLASGKILAVGNFRNYNGSGSTGIVRINPDGSRDTSFNVGPGLDSWGRTIKPLSNGQVVIGGWFTQYNNRGANRVVRINDDGSPDTSFNTFYGDRTAIYSIVQQANGQLITAGHSLNFEGLFLREIVRLNLDGTVDNSWPGSTNEKTEGLLMQPNGKVVVVGYFNQVNGQPRNRIGRFNADGTVDSTFIVNADNFVWCVAAATNSGKIFVSGGFTSLDGIARGGVARLNLPEGNNVGPTIPDAPRILDARLVNNQFTCRVTTQTGFNYRLQYKTSTGSSEWLALPPEAGTGGTVTLTDPTPTGVRLYRVEVQ